MTVSDEGAGQVKDREGRELMKDTRKASKKVLVKDRLLFLPLGRMKVIHSGR